MNRWVSVTHRLLGDQGDVLAVFLNIHLGDVLTIEKYVASQRVIEAFQELNAATLSVSKTDARNSDSTYTVLLPQPLAPTSATYVPGLTVMFKPRSTRTPGLVG